MSFTIFLARLNYNIWQIYLNYIKFPSSKQSPNNEKKTCFCLDSCASIPTNPPFLLYIGNVQCLTTFVMKINMTRKLTILQSRLFISFFFLLFVIQCVLGTPQICMDKIMKWSKPKVIGSGWSSSIHQLVLNYNLKKDVRMATCFKRQTSFWAKREAKAHFSWSFSALVSIILNLEQVPRQHEMISTVSKRLLLLFSCNEFEIRILLLQHFIGQ